MNDLMKEWGSLQAEAKQFQLAESVDGVWLCKLALFGEEGVRRGHCLNADTPEAALRMALDALYSPDAMATVNTPRKET